MNGRRPLVVLAAGGTGGHVFPAEALAVELSNRGRELAFLTDARGDAFQDLSGRVEVYRIRARGLAGKGVIARLRGATDLLAGTIQARSVLGRLKPGAVVGFGGYASFPTLISACLSGFATAIHEQNAVLGRANRLLARHVTRIATSFQKVRNLPKSARTKVVCTGMPVRPTVTAVRERPYLAPGLDEPIYLLVLGGSLGATVFSDVVPKAMGLVNGTLRGRLRIVQQCRSEDLERVEAAYGELGVRAELSTFFSDVPARLAEAHLFIGRAGASTVAELMTAGLPAMFVPYPYAIDDHQAHNARAVADAGAGWSLLQDAFTPENLAARLEELFGTPETLERAAAAARGFGRPDAAERLADVVDDLLLGRQPQAVGGRAA